MAISQNFPNTRPSLNLNFARSKTLDPRITFIRSQTGSEASYVDESGIIRYASADEPRFDHDPETGRCLGLMIEEQRTNVLRYSEEFDTGWTNTNASVTANATTAPDGTTTADKLVENSSTGNKEVNQANITYTSGTSLTFSCFAKVAGRTRFRFAGTTARFDSATDAFFDLSNGTVVTTTGGFTSASMEAYPNGWYRCVGTMLPTSSGTNNVFITLVNSGTTTNYTGDGSSGVFIWGAQLETGAFPTSYIPTTNSTATRSKDSVSMTGTNFSDWYNPSESTFLVSFRQIYDASSNVPPSTTHILQAGNDTTVNDNYTIRAGQTSTTWTALIRSASPSSLQFPGISGFGYLNSSTQYKAALSVNSSLISVSLNGSLNSDITNTTTVNHSTTFNKLFIGSGTGGLPPYELSGHISQLTYYPTRLSNTVLQTLTK